MSFYIYKCNSKDLPHQVEHGDWAELFDGWKGDWGSTEFVPALRELKPDDTVLAYQTDRNELVGVTKVKHLKKRGGYLKLYLRPIERIEAKVRPLKKANAKIARIPALQPGPIKTIYAISATDTRELLNAARSARITTRRRRKAK